MVRLVEEAIEVRVGPPQRTGSACGGEASAAPEQFLWRGRVYRVTGVLDRWQERHAWWRSATERPLDQVPLSREVWRVEARPGRGSVPGVYDLGHDGGPQALGAPGAGGEPGAGWLLLRTQD